MVMPRDYSLDRTEEALRDVTRRRNAMVQRGRLLSVDFDGLATVELFGRFGQTAQIQAFSLRDEPEDLIGLTVSLFVPSGDISDGVWILGADGAVGRLFDATVLGAEQGLFLEARDRLLPPDVDAWTGTAKVFDGQLVVVSYVRLTIQSITSGLPVLTFTDSTGGSCHFRQVAHESAVITMRPAQPFRATDDFSMVLSVDRTGLSDGVLEAFYTTETPPSSQRLRLTTTSGAGLPYMSLHGRYGVTV